MILRFLRALGHQDWIRYGIRNRLIRRFCNPNTVDSHEFEMDFFGSIYRGNLNCHLDWCAYFFGAYEKSELLLMRDLVQHENEAIFVDVGANIGHHSLFMSRYCKQVHAFEPYEGVRTHLDSKISYNNCHNIVVHSVGLGCKEEALPFFAPTGFNTGTGSFMPSHEANNNARIGELTVVNGDAYFSKLGLKNIHLIKIDVEGFEKF